jgi:hypothetical protein
MTTDEALILFAIFDGLLVLLAIVLCIYDYCTGDDED